ncbi:hypothetical protein SAMN05421857_1203 [Chryseobacterium formosense]|nr:hypothetical protein SAMN05421857_1203 [Chryseobacterium formosense]
MLLFSYFVKAIFEIYDYDKLIQKSYLSMLIILLPYHFTSNFEGYRIFYNLLKYFFNYISYFYKIIMIGNISFFNITIFVF